MALTVFSLMHVPINIPSLTISTGWIIICIISICIYRNMYLYTNMCICTDGTLLYFRLCMSPSIYRVSRLQQVINLFYSYKFQFCCVIIYWSYLSFYYWFVLMPFWLVYMESYGIDFLTPSFVIYAGKHHHHHSHTLIRTGLCVFTWKQRMDFVTHRLVVNLLN
jgi:hypothetical protein